jgi:hemerythrin-like domain-containing protein
MASTGRRSPNRSLSVALELLESDHRKVEGLFRDYEDAQEGDEEAKRQLARKICGELGAHAQLEEELFYPWLRDNLDEDDMSLVEEAQVEHNGAKDLIAQIEASGDVDPAFDAMVKVLGEYIKHHVREEEQEIFTKLGDFKEELDELGQEIHARKAELIEELGIEQEEEGLAASRERASHSEGSGAGRSR